MELTEEEITEKLPTLRQEFEEKYKAQIEGDTYDSRDITRFREDDAYAKCFLRAYGEKEKPLDEPLGKANDAFIFRKSIGVNDLTDDSIPSELKEREFLYWKGTAKEDRDILHFKVAKHKKGHMTDDVKKYIAHTLDQYQRKKTGVRMVLIFDFSGAGLTNMDMEVVKYIISCFSNYFPGVLAYILLFELPFLLSAAWKLIQTWLSDAQKKKIKLVKRKDITQYIDADQLEPDMLEK